MAYIKLLHPSGEKVSFEFGHAQRILKLQVKKNVAEASRWKMVKETPKQNDNKSGESKQDTKGGKTAVSS